MTPEEFITSVKQAALTSSAASLLPPGITIAQAAIESAWGESGLSKNHNNYFGLKAHGNLPTAQMMTEEDNGGVHHLVQPFACYDSVEACFADRDHLITHSPTYADAQKAWAGTHDVVAYVRAFAQHWATDPNYATKILQVYHAHGLAALDKAA